MRCLQNQFNWGASDFFYALVSDKDDKSYVTIIDSNFINNVFDNCQAIETFDIDDNSYVVLFFTANDAVISIRNTTLANNTGWYGAAVLLNPVSEASQ